MINMITVLAQGQLFKVCHMLRGTIKDCIKRGKVKIINDIFFQSNMEKSKFIYIHVLSHRYND